MTPHLVTNPVIRSGRILIPNLPTTHTKDKLHEGKGIQVEPKEDLTPLKHKFTPPKFTEGKKKKVNTDPRDKLPYSNYSDDHEPILWNSTKAKEETYRLELKNYSHYIFIAYSK